MSFFNSLQQYVTSSVANLSLSPKRFSLSRESSNGSGDMPPASPGISGAGSTSGGGRSASTGNATVPPVTASSVLHGFPKVVPPPGTVTPPHSRSLSARRKTLECPPVPGLVLPPGAGPPRRLGSFRKQHQHSQPGPAPAKLMFCRRRQSWPEVDQQATSG
ncbi:uncharacterized protein [Anabrus simplex]|uniref:uncharacterized protein n=1 Tax=Anabrus simplex TaxID=316456 RepID=UPI0034DD9C23